MGEITYFHMHDIREYIKDAFDVEYSISGLQKWLHRNGSPTINLNEHVRNNKYFATAKEFRQSIEEFFDDTLHQIGHALTSRINDNFQTFNFSF